MERQSEDLRHLLLELLPEQIMGFRDRFREQMDVAFRWDSWGAAYIIASGCSNDGFVYLRHWLSVEDVFFEEFAYVPAEAYEAATGLQTRHQAETLRSWIVNSSVLSPSSLRLAASCSSRVQASPRSRGSPPTEASAGSTT